MNEKQDYISRVFLTAKMQGLCSTQAEFAALLDVDRSTLSTAMNGKMTDRFFRRIERFAEEHGLVDHPTEERPAAAKETSNTEDWKQQLIESQQRTIESQQRTIEALTHMQVGTAYMGGVFAPKNSRTEK